MLKKILLLSTLFLIFSSSLSAQETTTLREDRDIKTIKLDNKRGDDKFKAGLALGYPYGVTAGYRFSNFFELNALAGSNYHDFTIGGSALFTLAEIDISGEMFNLSAGPAVYNHFGKNYKLQTLGTVRFEYSFKDVPINLFVEAGAGIRLVEFAAPAGSFALGARYIF
jgi:opacity protein-like surface antigen